MPQKNHQRCSLTDLPRAVDEFALPDYSKDAGRFGDPFFLSLAGWEVVQSVGHQPLELIILVRVQASQPISAHPESFRNSLRRRRTLPCKANPLDTESPSPQGPAVGGVLTWAGRCSRIRLRGTVSSGTCMTSRLKIIHRLRPIFLAYHFGRAYSLHAVASSWMSLPSATGV
jgi:hypothetical protein